MYFIGGKERHAYPTCCTSARKERITQWTTLREEGGFLSYLALYWCLHLIVKLVLDMHALPLSGEWENATIFSISFESVNMSDCSVWAF